jgi:UDP-2,3-diacylglucosamine hydrolase
MKAHPPGQVIPSAVPPWSVLQAPSAWRHIDFISDLHLQVSEPATFELWRSYMQHSLADAVFILGDLFEVWVGDDMATHPSPDTTTPSFEASCAHVLKAAAQRLDLYFIHGNRDFLLGPTFAQTCGMALLNDPTVLQFGGERWLLSHGDALCLDDTDYMKFRAEVRTPEWQSQFLKQPLEQRQAVARTLRNSSESRKRTGVTYADLDTPATCGWLTATQSKTLIHGHTHRPADHTLPNGMRRIVLSDWDASGRPIRAEVLRLRLNGAHPPLMQRLQPSQAGL